jgi:aspartate/methionine/tyrosine aminotransferase
MRTTYRRRRDLLVSGLKGSIFSVVSPQGTFYAMLDASSLSVAAENTAEALLDRYGIACVNGLSYGSSARGWVRLSLTQSDSRMFEAVQRLNGVSKG